MPEPIASAFARPLRLCFVSYSHLTALASSLIRRYMVHAEIEAVDAAFGQALSIARARESEGRVDAFISAGSNAALLKSSVRTPVATVKVGGYDILLALLKARAYADRVGVVTYGETIAELDAVKDLLNIDVVQATYRSAEEARTCFFRLAQQGCQAIVGSSIVVELAAQHGLPGVLTYSESAVQQALDDALEMARKARADAARYDQLAGVLHNLQEAVLAVDNEHRVIAANPAMERVLDVSRARLLGSALDDVDSALSLREVLREGKEERDRILFYRGREWVANITPIREYNAVVGAVMALHDANLIHAADGKLRAQRKYRRQLLARYRFDDLVGMSRPFQRALAAARRYAQSDATVLILGESGTGKELFAQAIHNAGARGGGPFVALNCSAMPEALLESELFGYEEGAFTGSRRGGKPGLLEVAHGGTLFLDEIGDMPIQLQTRLLRVVQEREVLPLGSDRPVPVDVRIVAATHQPLPALIAEKRFRADLYYRLNILRLELPPLRARGEDVVLLGQVLLAQALRRLGSNLPAPQVLSPLVPRMRAYDWPGNIRELENVCERLAVFFAQYDSPATVDDTQLPYECPELYAVSSMAPSLATDAASLQAVVDACGGNRSEAARRLGISRSTLWRRLRAEEAGSGSTAQALPAAKSAAPRAAPSS